MFFPTPLRILAATFLVSIGALMSPGATLFMHFVWLWNWSTLAIYIVPKLYRWQFFYAMLAAVVVTLLTSRITR